MIPTQDTNHVTEAAALLTSRYANLVVVPGLVRATAARLQQLENDCFALLAAVQLANHPMPGGPWNILDQLGSIVGAERNGLDDADYLALIKLTAKVNRSRGTAEDVLSLAALMSVSQPPLYLEMPTAGFYIACWNIALNYPLFVPLLKQARAAGVAGLFIYTTWPTGNDLKWSSRYDSTAGQGVWGSRYNAAIGGKLAAAVAV